MRVTATKTARNRLAQLILEELESRLCPAAVCDANPVYAAECAYVDALLPASQVTLTAVQSGNWSNPATWGGRLPTTGDNVWIPHGMTVTVDKQEPGALRSILDNGVLTFAPNVNTSLDVNTLVTGTDTNTRGTPQGELDIGTAAQPIQAGVTAQLIFADSQSVAPGLTQAQLFPNDTDTLSGGLISMGTLNVYGSQVTPYVNLVSASSTTLTLDSAPIGWKAGDTLLLAGDQPEEVQIAALNGTTVTLASPLQYTHSAPVGQSVQVADENRSVVVRDENTPTQYLDGSDGMVMEMHNDAAHIEYAAFLDPGRTDKSVPLGSTLSNGTVNHVARYSVHFHRDYYPGITNNDPPIQVIGCFQANGVGWGYDNHSSNVAFTNDVAYNDFGAAFVDEAGNELGSFQGCLAIDIPGVLNSADRIQQRSKVQDFGWNGEGFWLTSPSTSVIDNHVWDAQIGYALFTQGLIQGPLRATTVWGGKSTQSAPLAEFSGDTAGGVTQGLSVTWRTGGTIRDFTAWDVSEYGIDLGLYTVGITLESPTVTGLAGAPVGIEINTGGYTSGLRIDNANVTGFAMGTFIISIGVENINGGYWDDTQAFHIPPNLQGRQVTFSGNITFGPSVQTAYYILDNSLAQLESQQAQQQLMLCNQMNTPFNWDQILLPGGMELYTAEQAPDYVPFPAGTGYNDPPAFLGLTNAQLWDRYGMAPDNILATDATTSPLTNGLIGPAQTAPTMTARLVSSSVSMVGAPYKLKYALSSSIAGPPLLTRTDPSPVTVQQGWNVLTRVINGATYSWLIYGTVFSRPSVPDATLGVAYRQSIMTSAGYTTSLTVVQGAIPAGMSLQEDGGTLRIAGTPKTTGFVAFNLTATNSSGNTTTQRFSLSVDPRNITGQVNWMASPLVYNSSTNTYNGTITLTNNAVTTLTGTFMAVLSGLPAGISLANANGYYNGSPFVLLSLPGGKLPPGQSVTFTVAFRNPNGLPINYSLTTFQKSL